jgi:CSLREA domain-containing protein
MATNLFLSTGLCAAVVFTVNTIDDGVDVNPGNGICSTTPAPPYVCTLRAAVMEANRTPNAGATITLPAGHYTLQIFPDAADGEEKGDLNLLVPAGYSPGPTIITGAGAATTIVDANGIDRVFKVDVDRTVSIAGVTLLNGIAAGAIYTDPSRGGAILSRGNLALNDSVISDSMASYEGGGIYNNGTGLTVGHSVVIGNISDVYGGGIYSQTPASVSFSTISGNHASEGGGIYNDAGTLNIDHSTISGNFALDNNGFGQGGGIYVYEITNVSQSTISDNTANYGGGIYNDQSLVAGNSTISGNSATQEGGGIYSEAASSMVYNSTIAFNQADSDGDNVGQGGGIYIVPGAGYTFNMRNTVIAENSRGAGIFDSDCYGPIKAYGNNRLSGASNCTIAQSGYGSLTVQNFSTELGPLQDNGGPTQTHALVPPSSMINGGLGCVDPNGTNLTVDQRGHPRPPTPPFALILSTCDIGAFEYNEIFVNGLE